MIPRVTKLSPFLSSDFFHLYHFPHSSRTPFRIIYAEDLYPFLSNKRKDYIPARIVYRFINMHVYVYHTSLSSAKQARENQIWYFVSVFLSLFSAPFFSSPRIHPYYYVVTCVLVRFFSFSLASSLAPYNCKLFSRTCQVTTKSGSTLREWGNPIHGKWRSTVRLFLLCECDSAWWFLSPSIDQRFIDTCTPLWIYLLVLYRIVIAIIFMVVIHRG